MKEKPMKRHLHQMPDSNGNVLSSEAIDRRCKQIGDRLAALYTDTPFTLVAVLNGAVVFAVDLLRSLSNRYADPVEVEFVKAHSYKGTKSGALQLDLSILSRSSVEGRHVVLVDDILDTAQTMHMLVAEFRSWGAASVRPVVLLRKDGMQKPEFPVEIDPDDVGFVIPNKFVVGRGLDYNGLYRNLSWIAEYVGP